MANLDNMSMEARAAWGRLTDSYGRPLTINSAYRDPAHNAKVGGANKSQHIHGNAYDVDVSQLSREERLGLIEQARAAGFQGVGVYDNSLHFDVGPSRAWGSDYTRNSLPEWAGGAVGAPVGHGGQTPQGNSLARPAQGQQPQQAGYPSQMNALAQQQAPQPPQMVNNALDPRAFMTTVQAPQVLRFT